MHEKSSLNEIFMHFYKKRGGLKLKALSLYEEKNTVIHEIDPLSKMLYILVAILVPIIAPTNMAAVAFMILSILLLLIAKVFKKVIPIIGFSLIILVTVVIIQGLFRAGNKTPLFNIGSIVFYKEGTYFGLALCSKVINILCAFSLLVLTSSPSNIIESVVRKGLSPKIGYVLSSVLQIIPQMSSNMSTITDAQRSRGMETEGKLSVRIKAFFPLIGPVVMNSIVNTKERAMALEVRGFDSKEKKTFLNEKKDFYLNKFVRAALLIVLILSIVWRIVK